MRERISERLPVPILAMQLLARAETPQAALAALEHAAAIEQASAPERGAAIERIADLIAANPAAWRTVRAITSSVEHAAVAGDAVAHWAHLFDRLVGISPEGSVALYSLGSAQLLDEATAEIVALLGGWGLLDPPPSVLDVGCGIGRLESALASRVASITGLDISAAMLQEARRRCGRIANVRFAPCSGRDLSGIPDRSVDLVMLVDTLPYLMLSAEELAAALLADSARVLRPGGSIVILNASYRGDADADLADLARFAAGAGLHFLRADWRAFERWDAPAFQLVKR